jgi:KDO2-lipid IV(A) lauroyltransferase
MDSVATAFGDEKSEKEREQIVRECFFNLGKGINEMLYFMADPRRMLNRVEMVNPERLDAVIAEGKGAISVTAHFGNFPLMMLFVAQLGMRTNCIIRQNRDPKLEEYLLKKRDRHGLFTVFSRPRRKCVKEALQVLSRNELLFILMDQDLEGEAGVFVDFFGTAASTATGPIVFAKRADAVILPMFIVREKGNRHKIYVEEPYEIVEKDSEEETLRYNMQELTKKVESYARRYPSQWAWMHRRWRTQPPPRKGKQGVCQEKT